MILKTYREPPIDNNNYLIIDEQSKEAALIDCSAVDENIRNEIKAQGAFLKYILLTHGHFDHIIGVRDYFNTEVVMHPDDMEQLDSLNSYLPLFGMDPMDPPKINKFIKDGDILKLGNLEIKVLHTPGHTQGGVCFLVEDKLFTGDTIFRESVGRCDLPGGDFTQIVDSIETKIFTLPNETLIYPGHGKTSTVGWEKTHNCFM